ncbi:MAG: aspartate carbamoyltransferase [Candidatus Cloacimonetes bacterium]|nr:aspartate carbamoyltransferase [Candidatus Cloacimonadota bacterium]
MKNLISMRDLTKKDILQFLELAEKIEKSKIKPNLSKKLAALIFYEPSTRTQFSFATAMKKLGGQTITMRGTQSTSVQKGETFADTLKTISMYADLIIMRSAIEGSAHYASEVVDIPVINAGDGANQHPTQALLDLYSMKKTQGTLENLTIGIVGDLKFGRTVHSLVQAMSDFKPKFYFISPSFLKMPEYINEDLREKNVFFQELKDAEEKIQEMDLMYVTRIQKERFADPEDYEKVKGSYIIESAMLKGVKKKFKILHPLPRAGEISTDVDKTKYAYYFQQAKNGIYVRQAIIATLLGGTK